MVVPSCSGSCTGILSYHPMIQEKLCEWLFSRTRCLFFVTGDVVDDLLLSQFACQWISMPAMSLARDIETVPLVPRILSYTFLWQAFGPSSGPACLETRCCMDDPQHCSPTTSRRQCDWSLKTTPHPASTQCEILAPVGHIQSRLLANFDVLSTEDASSI